VHKAVENQAKQSSQVKSSQVHDPHDGGYASAETYMYTVNGEPGGALQQTHVHLQLSESS